MRQVFLIILFLIWLPLQAQEVKLKWWSPEQTDEFCIEGQGWEKKSISTYHRLPDYAEGKVRPEVWNLSKNSAGLTIRFRSNSNRIVVRYTVSGGHAMPHMPATGVSGVDLYTKTLDGQWTWCKGNYSFADTIRYDYKDIKTPLPFDRNGREYCMYLPLYNTLTHLEIGVLNEKNFEVLPQRNEKPIVVYGTSIAQGACASRPGMAWTSVLSRQLDWPLVNLGFSGNGRLEEPLIELMGEIDAKLFVLDCLPNMMPWAHITKEETYKRLIKSVKQLKTKRPGVPVLLTEHAGYSDGATNTERYELYRELNKTIKNAFADLLKAGVKNIYLLTNEEIAQHIDAFVDGTHPTDFGMVQYANAYEKSIREILTQPKGTIATTQPVFHFRDPFFYNWEGRHQQILAQNIQTPPDICVIGNSIVHAWSGQPDAGLKRGNDSWKKLFKGKTVCNMGCSGERIENALWRINHDELEGFEANQIIVMLGTNNLEVSSDEEMLEGYHLLFETIRKKQPKAKLLAVGILPRRDFETRVEDLNLKMAKVAALLGIDYCDPGVALLNVDSKIDESYFSDGVHPNAEGYRLVAKGLKSYIVE
jgi:lysophospholipase L1-like esterase